MPEIVGQGEGRVLPLPSLLRVAQQPKHDSADVVRTDTRVMRAVGESRGVMLVGPIQCCALLRMLERCRQLSAQKSARPLAVMRLEAHRRVVHRLTHRQKLVGDVAGLAQLRTRLQAHPQTP